MMCRVKSAECRVSLPLPKGRVARPLVATEGICEANKGPLAVDEESPIYDYCMALAECRVQS